jgi:hypothetical protein
MEQIKQYWDSFKDKMDQDPFIKKAFIGAVIATGALVLMFGIKSIKSIDQNPKTDVVVYDQAQTIEQAEIDSDQSQVVSAPAKQSQATASSTSSNNIVSRASKPLSELSKMTPGFVIGYSYTNSGSVRDHGPLANVANIEKDIGTFQFLAKPDESLNNQILPGRVVLESKASGYFVVEKQSSPLLNVLISSGRDVGRLQVYIDDQVLPAVDHYSDGYSSNDSVSIPVMQTYAAGLHRITVISTTSYNRRDINTAVRMSMKKDTDPAPIELQVYREVSEPIAVPEAQESQQYVTAEQVEKAGN